MSGKRQVGVWAVVVYGAVFHLLVSVAGIGHRVKCRYFFAYSREREVGGELYVVISFFAALGGDEDDAVGSSRAVYGCCRGILEHLNRLYVVRVDECQRVAVVVTVVVGFGAGRV